MKYSYRKEEQLLRMLYVEGGVWSRKEMAERLGMDDKHFERFFAKFIAVLFDDEHASSDMRRQFRDIARGKYRFARLRYRSNLLSEHILVRLYRHQKTLRSKEIGNLLNFIEFLQDPNDPLDDAEFAKYFGPKLRPLIEKRRASVAHAEIERTMNELEFYWKLRLADFGDEETETHRRQLYRIVETLVDDEEVVLCEHEGKVPFYRLDLHLFRDYEVRQLADLFYFAQFVANVGLTSAPGFMLLDTLKFYLSRDGYSIHEDLYDVRNAHFYPILDEHKIASLRAAIVDRSNISCRYYSKMGMRQASVKARDGMTEHELPVIHLTPLLLIKEHTYGRWYLVARTLEGNRVTYKLEGLDEIVLTNRTITAAEHETWIAEEHHHLQYAWLLAPKHRIAVKVRFVDEVVVRQRVLREMGEHGTIESSDAESFLLYLPVNDALEVKPWIRSFGSAAEVLEPLILRTQIASEWRELLEVAEQ